MTKETFADGSSYSYTYDVHGNMLTAARAPAARSRFQYQNAANPDLLTEVALSQRTVPEVHLQHRRPAHAERRSDRLHRQLHLRRPGPIAGTDRRQRQPDRPVHLRRRRQPGPAGQRQRHLHGLHLRRRRRRAEHHELCPVHRRQLQSGHSAVNSFDNYTYDALGNVLTDTNQDGKWVYTYDADGQLTQAVFTPNSSDPDGPDRPESPVRLRRGRQPHLPDGQRRDHDLCRQQRQRVHQFHHQRRDHELHVRQRRQPDRPDRRRQHDDLQLQPAGRIDRRERAGR